MSEAIQNKNSKKFLQNMVNSASPGQLLLMLYDGAIQWLHMSRKEIEVNKKELPNWTNFNEYIKKTMAILDHLKVSLRPEVGEELNNRLMALYDFYQKQLIEATLEKEDSKIIFVMEQIKDLRATWEKAVKQSQ